MTTVVVNDASCLIDLHKGRLLNVPAITASSRPRAAATWSDSMPRPVARGEHGRQVLGRERAGPTAATVGGRPAVAGEYPGGPLAGRVRLAGELRAEAGRGDRHRGARGGAPRVVEFGEVGGQGRVIEPEAVEPGVELAERGVGRGDLGERVITHNGKAGSAAGAGRCCAGRPRLPWHPAAGLALPADRGVGRGEPAERIRHDTGNYR